MSFVRFQTTMSIFTHVVIKSIFCAEQSIYFYHVHFNPLSNEFREYSLSIITFLQLYFFTGIIIQSILFFLSNIVLSFLKCLFHVQD